MALKGLTKEEELELTQCMKACAANEKDVRETAQHTFAAALTAPLRRAIFDEGTLDGIYEPDVLAPGAQANYPLDLIRPGDEDNFIAYVMPKMGRIPERHVEGDEIWVPTYPVANAIDWTLQYMRDARFDVVARALEVYKAGFVRKNNEDGWRTIMAAAADRGMIVTASGSAPFTGNSPIVNPPTDGAFVKELLSRAKTAMTRGAGGNGNAGKLTDVYLSYEAMEDVRAWGTTQVDEFTRREIMVAADGGIASIYGVRLHPMTEFGQGQEYQYYLSTTLAVSLPNNTLEWAIGLDLSTNDSFTQPVRRELETTEDPALHRFQKMGIYGSLEHGFCVLDTRRCLLMAF